MYSVITGGSSGLGLEIAKALAHENQNLIIIGRSPEKLEATKQCLSVINPRIEVHVFPFDIADESQVSNFVNQLEQDKWPVKALYNVAGSAFYGAISQIEKKDIDAVLNANLTGLMLITLKLIPYMQKYPISRQRIISILSTAALKGKRNETIYNAAKWGARGFLESVRDELSDTPMEVINVFPGGMKTPFWNDSLSGYAVETFMDPRAVAKHIVSISLDEAVYVNDITIGRPKG